jgi:hypothetical protein
VARLEPVEIQAPEPLRAGAGLRHDGRQGERAVLGVGLIQYLDVDPRERPLLSWRWKVMDLFPSEASPDDSTVRVVVSFAGDVQKLPFEDRLFFDQFRLFTGQQLPYAALMYVWGSRTPRDGIVPNGLTSRIKIIAVESGRGSWVRGWRRRATSRRTSGAPSAKSLAESSPSAS